MNETAVGVDRRPSLRLDHPAREHCCGDWRVRALASGSVVLVRPAGMLHQVKRRPAGRSVGACCRMPMEPVI
jgi:hypothetical protein